MFYFSAFQGSPTMYPIPLKIPLYFINYRIASKFHRYQMVCWIWAANKTSKHLHAIAIIKKGYMTFCHRIPIYFYPYFCLLMPYISCQRACQKQIILVYGCNKKIKFSEICKQQAGIVRKAHIEMGSIRKCDKRERFRNVQKVSVISVFQFCPHFTGNGN